MNKSNPFVPQGSLLEQQSKRRSHMKIGVLCVLAVSVTGLMAMLIQGCKRETDQTVENPVPPPVAPTDFPVATNPPAIEPSNPPVVVPPVVVPVPVEPTGTEYTVVKGDTLGQIAKNHGVTLKALQAANPNVTPTKLKLGQKLMIPAASTPPSAVVSPVDAGVEIYVVKSGDTLTKIAKAHGTTIKAIETENNLSTTKIKVGQKLKMPVKTEAAPANTTVNTPPTTAVPAPVAPGPAPAQ